MILWCRRERSALTRRGSLCLERLIKGMLVFGLTPRKSSSKPIYTRYQRKSLRGFGMKFRELGLDELNEMVETNALPGWQLR